MPHRERITIFDSTENSIAEDLISTFFRGDIVYFIYFIFRITQIKV